MPGLSVFVGTERVSAPAARSVKRFVKAFTKRVHACFFALRFVLATQRPPTRRPVVLRAIVTVTALAGPARVNDSFSGAPLRSTVVRVGSPESVGGVSVTG